MSAIIYRLTNTVNGKIYIGQTSVGLEQRWRQHCYQVTAGSTYHVHNAIRKYGPDAFTREILEETTTELINDRETYWIARFESKTTGYNMTDGGDGQRGWVPSEETRAKIRAARIGQHAGENHPLHGTKGGFYGKTHTTETKAKMSEVAKGKPKPAGFGEKISAIRKGTQTGTNNHMWGKRHSEETRTKIKAALAARRERLAAEQNTHQSS
jgi:group I intron endonuclease